MKNETIFNFDMEAKVKPLVNIQHLINWYWGTFCVWHENSTYKHYEQLKNIALSWGKLHMTHKEFVFRIRQTLTCDPVKRKIDDCQLCKLLGIS